MDETQAAREDAATRQPTAPYPPPPTADELRWGAASHLSVFVVFLGVPSPVGPLAGWLVKRGESAFVGEQAKEALNFSLSALVYFVSLIVMGVILLTGGGAESWVVLVLAAVAFVVASLVLPVVAAVRVSSGRPYRYPLTLRFV